MLNIYLASINELANFLEAEKRNSFLILVAHLFKYALLHHIKGQNLFLFGHYLKKKCLKDQF